MLVGIDNSIMMYNDVYYVYCSWDMLTPQCLMTGHACWLVRKTDMPGMVSEWARSPRSSSQSAAALQSFAEEPLPKELTLWGLTEASLVEGGRGSYMTAPAPAQLLVLLLPGEVNTIKRIARSHDIDPLLACDLLCDWMVSMVPKRCRIHALEDVAALGLDIDRLNRVALN